MASWLFIRGSESIWIERPFGTTLIVAGPGYRRERRTFINEDHLQRFQVNMAERLAADRWFLWAYNHDRRDAVRQRRSLTSGGKRRARLFPFSTPERLRNACVGRKS